MAAPVIEAGDCTVSGSNTEQATWAVGYPNAVAGDLLIFNIAWDDSTAVTSVSAPAGPNSETLTSIEGPTASASTEVRGQSWYTVATGTWTAGTRTFTPSASESWTATVIRVPQGEFDHVAPIGANGSRASAGTSETNVLSVVLTAGATDGGGTLVWFAYADADPLSATAAAGWTLRQRQDLGAVAHGVSTRDAATTNDEAIAGGDIWTIAGDSWASICYIVRGPVTQVRTPTVGTLRTVGQTPTVFALDPKTASPTVGVTRFVGQTPTVAYTQFGGNAWAPGAWAAGAWATGAWDVVPVVNETVSPSVGTVRVVGQTPTVGFTHSVTPTLGTVRFIGQTPSVGYTHSVTPTVGAVRLVGQTPTVAYTAHVAVAPSVGTFRLVGAQPTVGFTHSAAPSVGALVLAGQQPTVSWTDHIAAAPSVGTVRFDGAAPTVGYTHSVTPSVGTVRIDGQQPTVVWGDNQAVAPSVGSLVFVGQQPTVENLSGYAWHPNAWASGAWAVGAWAPDSGQASVSPLAGTLRLVGQQPTVERGEKVVAPSAGVLRFVGQQPPLGDTSALIDFATPATPLLAGDSLQKFRVLVRKTAGTNPTVDISVYENGAWVVDLSMGTAVTSESGQIVEATWDAALLSDASGAGVQCFVYGHSSADAQVEIGAVEWLAAITAIASPSVGTLRLVGAAPTVAYTDHVTVTPSVGTFRFIGGQPSATWADNRAAQPLVGTLLFAGQQPEITYTDHRSVAPTAGTVRFVGQTPTTGAAYTVAPSVGTVRFDGQTPSLSATANVWVTPSVGAVQFGGYAPVLSATAHQWTVPSAGTLRFDGQPPSLIEGGDKTTAPECGVLRFVGNAPSIPTRDVDQPTGGWPIPRRRRKHRDDIESEIEALEQHLVAEKILATPSENLNAARLRLLAEQYRGDLGLLDKRAQRALAYAQRAQTELSYQLALRELQRAAEDEELALIMLLASD